MKCKNTYCKRHLVNSGMACALLLASSLSMAEVFHGVAFVPTVVPMGETYIAELPINSKAPSDAKISEVTYNWNPFNEPAAIKVELCHSVAHYCLDVTEPSMGTTKAFNNMITSALIYYKVTHRAGAAEVPKADLFSEAHVYWE